MFDARYIIVEGNIGSGKTSLATMLAQRYESELVLEEFAENSFLPKFYENPERWAFPLELSFLADRYRQLKLVFENARTHNKLIISDYIFDKSQIFASKNLALHEQELYSQFFNIVRENLPQPDLIIYLNTNIDRLLKNISLRGRDYEKKISHEYLQKIASGYRQFLKNNQGLNILEIDNSLLDFINNTHHFEELIQSIDESLKNNSKTLFTAL